MNQTINPSLLCHPDTEALIPGKLYARLYHGRNHPTDQLDDWGFDGPTFGPLTAIVSTYVSTLRLHGETDDQEQWLTIRGEFVEWDGSYYGDWEIFIVPMDSQ